MGDFIRLPPLSKERRREVCVHEAGHAVIHALGGSFIYRLAVAPEGNTGDWTTEGRKGGTLTDLWGVCEASDFPTFACVRWNEAEMTYEADRKQFDTILRRMAAEWPKGRPGARGFIPGFRRMVRANVCACLAGPIAEQLSNRAKLSLDCDSLPEKRDTIASESAAGEEVWLDEEPDDENPGDDIHKAMGLSFLLPYRNEYRHAWGATEAALRRPDVWSFVVRLADELERVGDMDDFTGLLPEADPRWPAPPGRRRPR